MINFMHAIKNFTAQGFYKNEQRLIARCCFTIIHSL